MYLFLFFAIILVVSAVSALIEEKAVFRETLTMFVVTSLSMGGLALLIFFLSK